jgi:two-component system, cell cycle sensor histidine kinase and response regulator CckA
VGWRERQALRVVESLAVEANRVDSIREILGAIVDETGLELVGLRLEEGGDYPFYGHHGFTEEFVRLESPLVRTGPDARPLVGADGRLELACLCGRVIRGTIGALPSCVTPAGSFFAASLQEAAAAIDPAQLGADRGRCVAAGLETVALVPLRYAEEIVGLLYLGDRRRDALSHDDVRFFERLGLSIGVALAHKRLQALPRQVEDAYRSLAESMSSALAVCQVVDDGADFVLVEFNRRAEAIEGTTREQVLGRRVTEVLPGVRTFGLLEILQRVWRTGAAEHQPATAYRDERTGRVVWRESHVYRLPTGEVVALYDDVTEREQALTALRNSEEKLQKAFHSSAIAMTLSTRAEGRLLDVNDEFLRLTGRTREEVVGHTGDELDLWVRPEQRDHIMELLRTEGGLSNLEVEFRTKSGAVGTCSWSGVSVMIDDQPCLLASAFDVTWRLRAEAALRESEERFHTLADLLPQVVFETDAGGHLVYVNREAFPMFGYRPEDLEHGFFAADIIAPQDRTRVLERMALVMAGGATLGNEYLAVRRDGSTFPVLVYSRPIVREQRVVGMRGLVVDISETKRAEAERRTLQEQLFQAQKMESIGALAGGVAHDFNNLLGAIQGCVDAMDLELGSDFECRGDLVEIRGLVKRGAELTKGLLGFARRGKYDARPIDLNELMTATAEIFGRTRKNISLEVSCATELPAVLADRTQIEQVLLNLFVNGAQAMPRGGRLRLATGVAELSRDEVQVHGKPPGRYVRLSVEDTGTGMPKEVQDRVFEPFFTTKERGQGTGLGLPSSYGIVQNHGGFFTVTSEIGVGSTFSFYLPATEATASARQVPVIGLLRGSGTILVVDDEPAMLAGCARLLQSLGYTAVTVSSGPAALDIVARDPAQISLVILDLIMPGMSGAETLEALRRLRPDLKVLVSTGWAMDDQVRDLLDKGCAGILTKPFDVATLAQKVREVL